MNSAMKFTVTIYQSNPMYSFTYITHAQVTDSQNDRVVESLCKMFMIMDTMSHVYQTFVLEVIICSRVLQLFME